MSLAPSGGEWLSRDRRRADSGEMRIVPNSFIRLSGGDFVCLVGNCWHPFRTIQAMRVHLEEAHSSARPIKA